MPKAIRTDNGVPSASAQALFGLSKLAVWWLRLGIAIERIKPGCPQQNGRHELMHLTLKNEATKPAAQNLKSNRYFPWVAQRLETQEVYRRFAGEANIDLEARPSSGPRASTRCSRGKTWFI